MKYNMKSIMTKAWEIYRKNTKITTFGEALHRAWLIAKTTDENAEIIAKAEAHRAEQAKNGITISSTDAILFVSGRS